MKRPILSHRGWCWSVALVFVAILLLPSVIALEANRIDLSSMLVSPSRDHLLGTDENGRDVLRRLLQGARITLGVGIAGALIAVGLGALLGAIAGLRNGWIDTVLMRLVDFTMAVPTLFVILLFTALVPSGVFSLVLLIGLTGWMPVTRLIRGRVMQIIREPFVEAARAAGAGDGRLLRVHLLPNVRQIIAVSLLIQLSRAILAEATISFLGLGIQPPVPTWGNMLIGAQDFLLTAPWLALAPGLAITGTLLLIASLQTQEQRAGGFQS
jgi:peptide/nickel transport system permease protein